MNDRPGGEVEFENLVKLAMRHFLASKNTGCMFARAFAKPNDGPLWWLVLRGGVDQSLPTLLNGSFEGAAATSTPAIVVFPDLGTVEDVVALLACVAADPRWDVVPCAGDGDAVLVGVHWKTGQGERASVMGLGPLWTMPLHRRAPFISLVVWPGGHENEFRKKQGAKGTVSLIDMKVDHLMTSEAYADLWKTSRELATAFRSLPFGSGARPDVAFCLPANMRSSLDPSFASGAPPA